MVHLSPAQHAGLIQAFSDLGDNLDVLVIDTAAGIGESVVSFVRAAQEVLLVVCDEPTSITDAYALIKLLNRDYGMNRFRVLANMAQSPQEGRNLFAKLTKVTDRFLDVALQYVGAVPYDECVRKADPQLYPASPLTITRDPVAAAEGCVRARSGRKSCRCGVTDKPHWPNLRRLRRRTQPSFLGSCYNPRRDYFTVPRFASLKSRSLRISLRASSPIS